MAGTLKIRTHQIQVPITLKRLSDQTPHMMMAKEVNSAKIWFPHFRPSDNERNISRYVVLILFYRKSPSNALEKEQECRCRLCQVPK